MGVTSEAPKDGFHFLRDRHAKQAVHVRDILTDRLKSVGTLLGALTYLPTLGNEERQYARNLDDCRARGILCIY